MLSLSLLVAGFRPYVSALFSVKTRKLVLGVLYVAAKMRRTRLLVFWWLLAGAALISVNAIHEVFADEANDVDLEQSQAAYEKFWGTGKTCCVALCLVFSVPKKSDFLSAVRRV